MFNEKHGQFGLAAGTKVIQQLSEDCARLVLNFPKAAVESYIRQRTFIRIKYLNNKLYKNVYKIYSKIQKITT